MDINFDQKRKKYLNSKSKRSQFIYFHKKMIAYAPSDIKGENILPELELGCGVSPMKDIFPNIIASDIEESKLTDMNIDAVNLPFENKSLKTIYATNCFHHISDKRKFIDESYRVLSDKGRLIMLEPSFSLLSMLIYPFLFKDESYNIFSSINQLNTCDPMKGANQASSYICFAKNRKIFLKDSGFNVFEIFHCQNSFAYLFSGGINFQELLPYSLIKRMMKISFLSSIFSLHWIIVLQKN